MLQETYISVDIETSGPIPAEYSILSIGACVVFDTTEIFYTEIKPLNKRYIKEAIGVHGLSIQELLKTGTAPKTAIEEFSNWIKRVSMSTKPVFVAFNATFDWMFMEYYFQKFLGYNPFGVSGLDIKAYYMGMCNSLWQETSKNNIKSIFPTLTNHTHHALDDAIEQAELLKKIMEYNSKRK